MRDIDKTGRRSRKIWKYKHLFSYLTIGYEMRHQFTIPGPDQRPAQACERSIKCAFYFLVPENEIYLNGIIITAEIKSLFLCKDVKNL